MAGRGFQAHAPTIEEHAGRTENRAAQLHSHADSIGGTSLPGHALGSIGGGLTGSMTSHYQQAGSAVHDAGNRMSTIASTERTNASNYRNVEADNAQRFRSIMADGQGVRVGRDPNTPPPSPGGSTTPQSAPTLHGTDLNGNPVTFTPGQVQSVPLRDSNGRLVGVSFPTKAADPVDVPQWAGMNNRTSDQYYLPAKQTPSATPGGAPTWSWQPGPQTTPWANAGTPVYVHAHADPTGYDVQVNTGTAANPNWQVVGIDGTTHGHVIAGNQYYQQAAGANPNSPLVMMSCSAAKPGGTAAADAAAALHAGGDTHDVYAPTGTGLRFMDPAANTSWYGVEETTDINGNPVPGSFQHYPAPPPPPAAPAPSSGGGTP